MNKILTIISVSLTILSCNNNPKLEQQEVLSKSDTIIVNKEESKVSNEPKLNLTNEKNETIEWLNSKFGGDQPAIYSSEFSSFSSHLEIKNDGSFIVINNEELNDRNGNLFSKDVTTFAGNFKDISASSFRVQEVESYRPNSSKKYYYLFMSCLQGNCIKQTSYKTSTKLSDNQIDEVFENKEVLLGVITENMDQTLVERGKKAFIYLTELCGGEKEKF